MSDVYTHAPIYLKNTNLIHFVHLQLKIIRLNILITN